MPSEPFIIPAGSTVTGTGYLAQTYYRRLASELGFYQSFSTTAQAAVGDTTRYILSDELRDDEAEYDYFGRPWVYIAGAAIPDTQRRILSNRSGHQGPLGALMVSRPFPQPIPVSTLIEVTHPLPIRNHLGVKGLWTCVNEALDEIWIPIRISFTGNGTNSYNLASTTAYAALMKYAQSRGIFDTRELGTTMPATRSPWGYELLESGVDRTLLTETRYNTSETFYLDFVVRGSEYIFDGASWGYRATNDAKGIINTAQQAAAPVDWVLAFGMRKALDHLIEILLREKDIPADRLKLLLDRLMMRKKSWALACARIMIDEFPDAIPERSRAFIDGVTEYGAWSGTFIEPSREVPLVST